MPAPDPANEIVASPAATNLKPMNKSSIAVDSRKAGNDEYNFTKLKNHKKK